MGITEKDMTNGKIYLHAVTFANEVLNFILIDDNVYKLYEFIKPDENMVRELVNSCVEIVGDKFKIKRLVYEDSQVEYIKKFARVFVGIVITCTKQFEKLINKRDIYKRDIFELPKDMGEYEFAVLEMFDCEYTKDYGKIKEDVPTLLFG